MCEILHFLQNRPSPSRSGGRIYPEETLLELLHSGLAETCPSSVSEGGGGEKTTRGRRGYGHACPFKDWVEI